MRILIVGAGIAGMTLAGLLRQRGQEPKLIERAASFGNTGYMLGLYPLGGRVLHGLGLHDKHMSLTQPTHTYSLWNSRGRHVQDYPFGVFTDKYGPLQMTSRGDLLSLLQGGTQNMPIAMETSVAKITQQTNDVEVTFSDGSSETFDLVVGADGMHSTIRELVFGETPLKRTGWGGWVFWIDTGAFPQTTVCEYWGKGCMVGMYPTKDRIGCFAGGPEAKVKHLDAEGLASFLQSKFGDAEGPVQSAIQALPATTELFYWEMSDVRAKEWRKGRVILLGDAAAGFLPTAGVGASMAMESAAALNDELSRVDASLIPNALALYEKRRRTRVEAVQTESRKLGKLMFAQSAPLVLARDILMKFYTLEMGLKDIIRMMDEPI